MSKELETQPYRVFKEYLDKIITMPDNIKNELVEIFEKKRLERQKEEERQEEQERQEEKERQEEQERQEQVVQQEEVQPQEEQVVQQEEEDKNSLFDRFFSQSQSLQPEQKPVLNPPQHKCKIRDW
jgi:hypothetical protein